MIFAYHFTPYLSLMQTVANTKTCVKISNCDIFSATALKNKVTKDTLVWKGKKCYSIRLIFYYFSLW